MRTAIIIADIYDSDTPPPPKDKVRPKCVGCKEYPENCKCEVLNEK